MPKTCGARLWSYDHWHGQRNRHGLLSRYRFNNYTGARVPRIWRLKALKRVMGANRRLKRMRTPRHPNKPTLLSYRQVLWPDKFEPVPVTGLRAPQDCQ